MSALKFKSKINVPGVECSGEINANSIKSNGGLTVNGNITGVKNISLNGQITGVTAIEGNKRNEILQGPIAIDSSEDWPLQANYIDAAKITLGKTPSTIITPRDIKTSAIQISAYNIAPGTGQLFLSNTNTGARISLFPLLANDVHCNPLELYTSKIAVNGSVEYDDQAG